MQFIVKPRLPLRSSARIWMRDEARALLLIGIVACAASCSDSGLRPLIVTGTVRVRDGAPLAGATVGFFEHVSSGAAAVRSAAQAPSTDPGTPVVVTDAQGRYAISVTSGHYDVWVGGVADAGIMPVQVTDVVVNDSHLSLDLSYLGYHVTGMMTHLGLGLASGTVFVLGPTNTARAELAENGAGPHAERTYSLLLPAGTYDFWANPNEGYWGVPRVKFEGITVSADTMIDLPCDGHFVKGTVRDQGGAVVYGAIVGATSPNASAWNYTDSNGFYGLHLPDGVYEFLITPPSGADTLGTLDVTGVTIDAPQTLDFVLGQHLPVPAPLPPPPLPP